MSKTLTIVNTKDDSKDLGFWILDILDQEGSKTGEDRFHPILGAACDLESVAKAKAENKRGPYPPEVEISERLHEHMLEEIDGQPRSPMYAHWLKSREIYIKEAA